MIEHIIKPPKRAVRILLGAALAAFLLLSQAATAFAYGWNWDMPSFTATIKINEDSSIAVKETITADFSREQHHGILRSMPVNYTDKYGNNLSLRVKILSITDENGKPWDYEERYEGEYLRLQIGSANTYLTGLATFIINYQVERAVTFFDDHDELYWNVTGTESDVPIKTASADITLPGSPKPIDLRAACYTGGYGSRQQNCTADIGNGIIHFASTRELAPYEGLTVVAGMPVNLIAKPAFTRKLLWFMADNWDYLIPFVVFGILYYLWYTRGRDPRTSRNTIMPIYTPPDKLTPTEIGTIIDESVDMRDISSAIVDLAVRGYIKIIETKEKVLFFNETDYEFKKLKDFEADESLKEHEKKILSAIFGGGDSRKLSDLNNKFYKDLPEIKSQVYSQLVKDRYFPASPDKTRSSYACVGIVLIFIIIFGAAFIIVLLGLAVAVGVGISGILFLVFSRYMPVKTKKGVDTFWQIKGLEEYINTAEADRIKFQEKENIFEKLLPYAMTLGIAQKWTKTFANIYKTPPSWYQSNDPNFGSGFTTYYLLNRLDRLNGTMQTTFTSSPRSSGGGSWSGSSGFGGGGFSGGGFGGGGVGAW